MNWTLGIRHLNIIIAGQLTNQTSSLSHFQDELKGRRRRRSYNQKDHKRNDCHAKFSNIRGLPSSKSTICVG